MPTHRKENLKVKLCCMDCTRTMTQCMFLLFSDQGFPNRGQRILPQWRGKGNFAVLDLIYMVWKSDKK